MKRLALILCVLAFAPAGTALAQPSGEQGYSGPGGISRQIPAPDGDGGGGGGGGLPFSGADLIVLGAAGGVLVLTGFALRHLTHGGSRNPGGSHP